MESKTAHFGQGHDEAGLVAALVEFGSSQRSVQLRLVFMANKSSIVSDLRALSTLSVLGKELQAPGKCGHSRRRNREGPAGSRGLNSQRRFGPAAERRRKFGAAFHGLSWFVAV